MVHITRIFFSALPFVVLCTATVIIPKDVEDVSVAPLSSLERRQSACNETCNQFTGCQSPCVCIGGIVGACVPLEEAEAATAAKNETSAVTV